MLSKFLKKWKFFMGAYFIKIIFILLASLTEIQIVVVIYGQV
jgi:hypothetical protein